MPIKTVIFDLDGTITEPFLDFDQIRLEMGFEKDAGDILSLLKPLDSQKRKEMESILLKHEQHAVQSATLNQGVRETLEQLRAQNFNIGILTRNTKENVKIITTKHDLKIDRIIDRDDGPAKPHPFGVQSLCDIFETKPCESMVVGDYVHDLQAAKAAGAYAILIKNHKNYTDFLEYADYTVDYIPEILDIIETINSQ